MQVNDLQQYLTNLSDALVAGKAKSVSQDLRRVSDGLQPFADLTVDQFAEFLSRAEEYHRTGIVPAQAKKSTRRAAAVDQEAVASLAQSTISLLERVMDESVTYKDIDAHMKHVGKLKAAEVRLVAGEIGIPGSFKTKGQAIAAISELLTSKKQTGIITSRI